MNTLIIPENVTEKNENYYNILKGLCYAVDKFGIDIVIEDLEQLQKEKDNKEE